MALVWSSYRSDLGRAYPMYALSIVQTNDADTSINPIDLLPSTIQNLMLKVQYPCGLAGLTPRKLSLWLTDGANFLISYPVPFDENLAEYLTANTQVSAWEFIGEKVKYGRLKRMLDNV